MFSLVLPAHNESHDLENCVKDTVKALEKMKDDYEIIIAEDGSTDNTYEIAKKLASENPQIRVSHSPQKLGRGLALKKAFAMAEGDKVGYMDIDQATDIGHLDTMMKKLEDYDIVTGSRLLKKSRAERKLLRYFLSVGFNMVVRVLLRSKVHDHQCGFKGFRKETVIELNKEVRDNHWFWDTEILVIGQKKGYSVYEFPVSWKEKGRSKVKIKRDIINMGTNIIRMFLR